jgi:hypothetical protein
MRVLYVAVIYIVKHGTLFSAGTVFTSLHFLLNFNLGINPIL